MKMDKRYGLSINKIAMKEGLNEMFYLKTQEFLLSQNLVGQTSYDIYETHIL